MLPLYRMPVVYVALALVGGAALGAYGLTRGRDRPNPPGPVADDGATITAPEPDRVATIATTTPPPAVDDGILRTEDGLRRKVLIRSLGLRLRDRPRDGTPVGDEPGLYSLWYVHGEAPGQIQVGPAEGGPAGWLPADGVLEWDTRIMVRPVVPGVLMFQGRACLLAHIGARPCPKHPQPGTCPGARLPEGAESSRVPMGLPVLRSEAIPQPEGPDQTVFEVASLVRETVAPPPVQVAATDRDALRDIYIALVMDTTGSMVSFIERAKDFARSLASEAGERYRDVRFHLALVEYRDDQNPKVPAGYEFTTRIACPFVDPPRFLESLAQVKATRYGDGSVDERVLEGLTTALPPNSDHPADALKHLRWPRGRSGELATKLIVLIGDAPDHAADAAPAAALGETLRKAGISLAAVSIRNPILTPGERSRYLAQWHALAEGAYRPRDSAATTREPIPPIELALEDAESLLPGLQHLIDDRVERARLYAEVARAEAENTLKEYQNRQGLTLDQVALVLEDLHRAAPGAEAMTRDGETRRAPQVQQGWVAGRDARGPLVRVEMLMSRPELDRLLEDLRQFQEAIASGVSRREDLLKLLSASASGERGFLEQDRGGETFADYLRRRGLPPARPDSLLNRRQGDLLQTDRLTRDELNQALARAIAELTRRRESPDWGDPARLVDGSMASVPYEPIDF